MKNILHSLYKKESVFFRIAGILCVFFQFAGYFLAKKQHISWSLGHVVAFLALSCLTGTILGALLYYFDQKLTHSFGKRNTSTTLSSKHFLIIFVLILVCWLPVFLAYYPGICSYDFSIQMGQVESGVYSDHHPFMHTLCIQFFWNLGKNIFSSGTIGIAFYTVFQMLILIGSFIYSLYILNKCMVHRYWIYFLAAFYAFFPPNVFMGISATKDTIFAAFVLIMMSSLLYVIRSFSLKISCKSEWIVFFIGCIGTIFFRNNGRYAVLAMLAILLLLALLHRAFTRKYFNLLLCSFLALVIAITSLNLTQSAIQCTQGDRREMLSIPIQQWARIINRHEAELDAETVTFIKKCIDETGLYEYDPYISDPVKRHTHTNVILQNAGTFIQTYIKLFLAYPDEYINAFFFFL